MAQTAGEHRGCTVTGRVLSAAGGAAVSSLTVRPARSAIIGGVTYDAVATQVTVGADGRWRAVLLPSALVGAYRVMVGRDVYEMVVPDLQEAAFERIAVRVKLKSARDA